jgi:hypothetical protein
MGRMAYLDAGAGFCPFRLPTAGTRRRRSGARSSWLAAGEPDLASESRGGGTRTPGLRFWRPPLYQLSYAPGLERL